MPYHAAMMLKRELLLIHYRRLADAKVDTLVQATRVEGGGVLVLSGAALSPEKLQALLDEVDCPVLLVR